MPRPHKENPLYSLSFNILLPVIILNKGKSFLSFLPFEVGSVSILFLALAFPFLYGLVDFIKLKKINFVSVLGLVGVALTGGLALFQFEGIYFAIKEGIIPLLFAIAGLVSILLKKPFVSLLIFKSELFDIDLMQRKIKENKKQKKFKDLMDKSTLILSASFVLSAILNFIIAILIFKKPDPSLSEEMKRDILNQQVADMTWMGWVFIALPLTFITGFLLWWIIKNLKQLTGLSTEELIPEIKAQS